MKQNNYCTMPAILLLAIISIFTFLPQQSGAQSVVISQVYGGGGNTGATYTHDYVELFNPTLVSISLTGWSVQYASATGTSWSKVNITSGILQPGQYFLIQLAGGANGVALPTPDLTSTTINMATAAGKIVLVDNQTTITSGVSCPTGSTVIDLVGFGTTANCFEGSGSTPAPSVTNAIFRANSGCTDTNNNSADFSASAAAPRNSQSTLHTCQVACVSPVITCPSNINVNNGPGLCGANVNFSATATGTSPTITYSHAPGSFFLVGSYTVTATANNSCGTSTCTFTVTVDDTEPPVAACQNVVLSLDANGAALLTPQMVNNGSSDNCTANPTLSLSRTNFTCADLSVAPPSTNDLIISEYVEGSSFNKYIEIYNGTGTTVNLSNYELRLYSNGSPTISQSMNLGVAGNLASGSTVVFSHAGATAYSGTTYDNSAVINFNGDDAVVLFKISANSAIDIFGQTGVDPGTQWSVNGNSTADKTLRRKLSVNSGNSTNASGFPSLGTEWNMYNQDDVSGLGFHGSEPNVVTLTVTDAAGNSSTCTSTITVADNIPPAITCPADLSFCDGETIVIGNATATDNCSNVIITNNAPANFSLGSNIITWTATDAAGNSVSCTQTVTVHYLNAIVNETDVLCYGDNSGIITVNYFAIPPANPADILYSVDGGLNTQSSNVFDDLYSGNYNVSIINTATNCTTTVSAFIDQPLAPLTVITTSTNSCPGGNTGTLSA
ncbi:MAG: lamin tail domain-containing protein, partial [Bacteroidia bacterium]